MSRRCRCPICQVNPDEEHFALRQFEAWVNSCDWRWPKGQKPSFEYSVAPGYYKDMELALCWEAWREAHHAMHPDDYLAAYDP